MKPRLQARAREPTMINPEDFVEAVNTYWILPSCSPPKVDWLDYFFPLRQLALLVAAVTTSPAAWEKSPVCGFEPAIAECKGNIALINWKA